MKAPYPWQDVLWQHLSHRLSCGAMPHALLLSGASGLGKNDFAEAWARRMLCAQPDERGACGYCKYCQLMDAGTHPDLCLLAPEEGSKAIRVDQVRDMMGFVTSRARFDGYKVVILSPAEAMNTNAANALLKCLEEPGEKTLFLLVTDAPRQLLPTIRSRCQTVAFPIPDTRLVVDWLVGRGLSRHEAEAALKVAGGSPFKAMLLAQEAALSRRDAVFNAWRGARIGTTSLLQAAEVIAGGGSVTASQATQPGGAIDALQWIAQWWQEVTRLKLDAGAALMEDSRRSGLLEVSARVDQASVFGAWDSTLALISAFQRGANFNVVLAVEGLLIGQERSAVRVTGQVL